MSGIDGEYFALHPGPLEGGTIVLAPDDRTARRHYLVEELVPGAPLVFVNGFAEEVSADAPERIDDMMSALLTFGVSEKVRAILEPLGVPGLQFYPMIYEATDGTRHEDFWFMNFFERRDVLDLRASELLPGEDPEAEEDVVVLRFRLDEGAVRELGSKASLLFLPDRAASAMPIAHGSVVEMLQEAGVTGYRATPLEAYSWPPQD